MTILAMVGWWELWIGWCFEFNVAVGCFSYLSNLSYFLTLPIVPTIPSFPSFPNLPTSPFLIFFFLLSYRVVTLSLIPPVLLVPLDLGHPRLSQACVSSGIVTGCKDQFRLSLKEHRS